MSLNSSGKWADLRGTAYCFQKSAILKEKNYLGKISFQICLSRQNLSQEESWYLSILIVKISVDIFITTWKLSGGNPFYLSVDTSS